MATVRDSSLAAAAFASDTVPDTLRAVTDLRPSVRSAATRCQPRILAHMWTLELPFETWRAIIDILRAKGLPYMTVHADEIEARLDQTPADQELVTMTFNDDVYLRPVNWACWRLGIPRPAERQM